MSYSLDFELDILPRINSADNVHWRVKAKERDTIDMLVRGRTLRKRPKKPLAKARVRLTRFSSSEPDTDNLAHSWKFVLDALRACEIIFDDRPSVIGSPEFVWEKAAPKHGKIRIQVWEIV